MRIYELGGAGAAQGQELGQFADRFYLVSQENLLLIQATGDARRYSGYVHG